MKEVTIQRKYVDSGQKWKDITLDQAIHDLESGGYWKEGTSSEMLKEGTQLWTPFAFYRKENSEGNLDGLSKATSKLEKELRLEIKRHLDKCSIESMPNVCEHLKTKKGYQGLETRIIGMVIKDQITPSGAIAQIESEL